MPVFLLKTVGFLFFMICEENKQNITKTYINKNTLSQCVYCTKVRLAVY